MSLSIYIGGEKWNLIKITLVLFLDKSVFHFQISHEEGYEYDAIKSEKEITILFWDKFVFWFCLLAVNPQLTQN